MFRDYNSLLPLIQRHWNRRSKRPQCWNCGGETQKYLFTPIIIFLNLYADSSPEEPKKHQNTWQPRIPLGELTSFCQDSITGGKGACHNQPQELIPQLNSSGFELLTFRPRLAPAMFTSLRHHCADYWPHQKYDKHSLDYSNLLLMAQSFDTLMQKDDPLLPSRTQNWILHLSIPVED